MMFPKQMFREKRLGRLISSARIFNETSKINLTYFVSMTVEPHNIVNSF